jgi:hypothetical protein
MEKNGEQVLPNIVQTPCPTPLKRGVVLYICSQGKEQDREFAANHSPGPI